MGRANIAIGVDGNLLVTNANSNLPVMRFSPVTGQDLGDFIPLGSGGLVAAGQIAFGPDGNLYVASIRGDDRILRFNGTTGDFIDAFISLPSHRSIYMSGYGPPAILFGPDGDVYLTDQGNNGHPPGHSVMRFDGTSGAYKGEFVTPGSGGLLDPIGMAWGPDGHLYVASAYSDEVLRYDGATGYFIDRFIPAGRGGLDGCWELVFTSTLEPSLAGWTLYLDNNRNGQLDFGERYTTTDAQGNYVFTDVAPGTYLVAQDGQPRWAQTVPTEGGYTVTVADGQIVTGVDFGNQQLTPDAKGEFRGTIFNDLDGNGITDGSEYLQGIPGRSLVIYLDQNQNGRRDPDERFLTVSDDVDPDPASPTYNFTDLDPGTYTVALERVSGWRQTTTGGIVNTPPLYAIGNGIGDNSSNLYRVDDYAASPRAVSVGETGVLLHNLAVDPISGQAYAISSADLYVVDVETGAATLIGPTGVGMLTVLAFSLGTLYAMGSADQTLYRINPATGAAIAVFNTGYSSTGDLAFDTDGSLYLTTGSQLVRLDVAHSQAKLVGDHGVSGMVGLGLDYTGGFIGLQGSDADGTARLYTIHKSTGAATLIGDVTDATAYGAAGLSFDAPRIVSAANLRTYQITITGNEVIFGVDFGIVQDGSTNHSPVFTSTAPNGATVNQLFRYDAKATDADKDLLTFALDVKPAGMVVVPTNGIVIWTPSINQIGTHDVTLRVQDGYGGVAFQSFRVTVNATNAVPVITSVPKGPAVVDLPWRYQVTARMPTVTQSRSFWMPNRQECRSIPTVGL